MKLESVVPWGRSLNEYRSMFSLTEEDLNKKVLGCGDGPASFNAELAEAGKAIVSIDPVYRFTTDQLRSRIDDVYHQVMGQMAKNVDNYVWGEIQSLEHLGQVRMTAMEKFLSDYDSGRSEGRYINASLPELPFEHRQFDLALCSHFLFLYSEQIDLNDHVAGIKELCRVANEVRIYPLLTLDGRLSPHLEAVCGELQKNDIRVSKVPVMYQFQKGAIEMLVAKNSV